jgi:quinol-cytochrome oxidoreductase complex cytochrome b subunit
VTTAALYAVARATNDASNVDATRRLNSFGPVLAAAGVLFAVALLIVASGRRGSAQSPRWQRASTLLAVVAVVGAAGMSTAGLILVLDIAENVDGVASDVIWIGVLATMVGLAVWGARSLIARDRAVERELTGRADTSAGHATHSSD